MTRALDLLVVVTAVTAAAAPASADTMFATRTQPMVEVSHTVDIRIENGIAIYKVQRQFSNPGKIADEVGLAIDLPAGGAATGLRIRAKDRWYDGVLMEREAAAALYKEMTGLGAYQPKDPALLQWLWADKLYLQVFPVMPGAVSTVEYTLTVPTRYVGGRYYISYPRVDAARSSEGDDPGTNRPLATPTITVHPAWGDAQTLILVDGQRVAPDTALVLTPPVHQPWEDTVAAEQNASYVSSTLEIPESAKTTDEVKTAKLVLDLAHTYQGDLKVELITPQGEVISLLDRTGGGDNALKSTRTLTLPAGTKPAGTWRLVASDHAGLDTGSIDAWSLEFGSGATKTLVAAADTPVFIPDAPESAGEAGVATIAVEPPKIDVWTGRYGRVYASEAHSFGKLEVDVAPRVSELPKRAQVVFVVDASYSMDEDGLAAQLDVIRAYLAHVPDAEIEIIAARRHASRVFGAFVPASAVDPKLAAARAGTGLALGNGSALDEAAALAVTLVEARKGPRRIVLLTDELLRSSVDTPTVLKSLAKASKDTVIHVVAPGLDSNPPEITRDDGAVLATLATKHRGIFARIDGLPAKVEKELIPVALELVRPTHIDKLVVTGAKVEETVLHEGAGVRVFFDEKSVAAKVTIRGELWSVPVTRTLEPTAEFNRATAAFVFGADMHQELTPAEQMKVALLGRAVSPVTSYVAAEPGTRPSVIGLEGTIGHGSGTGSGYGVGGGMGSMRGQPPEIDMIDTRACVAQHKPAAGWSVELGIETTKDEIVDVETKVTTPFAACLVEAAWLARLDSRFREVRAYFHVTLK